MRRRIESDRRGLSGSVHIRLYDWAEGMGPKFEFDCRRTGLYCFRIIDRELLQRYLDQGIEGDYQESEGQILWVEPVVLY